MTTEISNENILFGGTVRIDVSKDVGSLGEYILRELASHGDTVLIVSVISQQRSPTMIYNNSFPQIDGITDKKITARQLIEGSLRMAAYFQRMGIVEGDVIGITSENCIEIPLIVFGAYFLGAAITTCNLTYTEDEMRHALNLSKPKIVFASPYAVFNLEPVVKNCPFIKALIQFGEMPLLDGVQMFQEIISDPTLQMPPGFKPVPVDITNRVGMIMLSSGTTGLPKGVEITQSNILASCSMSL